MRTVAHRPLAIPLLFLSMVLLAGCSSRASQRSEFGGNAARAPALIREFGCGSCHDIPGIAGANGLVGPPLERIGTRVYIAGMLRNTPENMVRWLQNPQAIVPGNVMPNMHISASDARDIAAYLYTLD